MAPSAELLNDWKMPPVPHRRSLAGSSCSLHPLRCDHASPLFDAYTIQPSGERWRYLPYGPFDSLSDFNVWVHACEQSEDTHYYCVCIKHTDGTETPAGISSYLRIKPDSGSIEVGHIHYSSLLQNTRAATDAMYLMMANAFALGYRRYEWKCDALNEPSRKAALRLGFTFEGIFRQATIVKGRNRDTAWYSILDCEWKGIERGYKRWLANANFDEQGAQIERLEDCIKNS